MKCVLFIEGSNQLLMVEVLPGRSTDKTDNPDGFDCYEGPFHNGKTILVPFTTEQALPCFVVHYSGI